MTNCSNRSRLPASEHLNKMEEAVVDFDETLRLRRRRSFSLSQLYVQHRKNVISVVRNAFLQRNLLRHFQILQNALGNETSTFGWGIVVRVVGHRIWFQFCD